MNAPRLMLFAPSAYPLGGVATWASYLLPGLSALGWRPTLALTHGRFHDPAAYLAVHPFTPAVSIPCGAGTQASRVRSAARAIADADPHVVAAVNLPDVILAAARLRRRGRFAGRIVAVEHGLARETLIDMRTLAPTLDAFMATNELTAALARGFAGLAPRRVFYAPCGVPTATRPGRSPREKLTLLYAGRLEQEQKRVHDLADLADALAARGVAFRLRIAGAGPEEQALRRRFAGAAHEVEFLGAVEHDALCGEALPEADALLVLSSWETGPIVAFEAMAAGVPVVSSRYVGSGVERALVDGETCLMFPVGDMRAAAVAVARLFDAEVAARLSRAGLALVAKRYRREASIARWDEVLREVLAQPPLAPTARRETLRAAGRLDRWLGAESGDRVRRAFGIAHAHTGPGGEWPHLLQRSDAEADAYDRLVMACEAGAA